MKVAIDNVFGDFVVIEILADSDVSKGSSLEEHFDEYQREFFLGSNSSDEIYTCAPKKLFPDAKPFDVFDITLDKVSSWNRNVFENGGSGDEYIFHDVFKD